MPSCLSPYARIYTGHLPLALSKVEKSYPLPTPGSSAQSPSSLAQTGLRTSLVHISLVMEVTTDSDRLKGESASLLKNWE